MDRPHTGYENWPLADLERFIRTEQDELRQLNLSIENRARRLRLAVRELEQRLRKAVGA